MVAAGRSECESRKLEIPAAAVQTGVAQESELSAKGAEYDSQGQAPNNVRRVAPGYEEYLKGALKVRNSDLIIPLFQSFMVKLRLTRGDVPHVVRHLPLAVIFRAFGAGGACCHRSWRTCCHRSLVAEAVTPEAYPIGSKKLRCTVSDNRFCIQEAGSWPEDGSCLDSNQSQIVGLPRRP